MVCCGRLLWFLLFFRLVTVFFLPSVDFFYAFRPSASRHTKGTLQSELTDTELFHLRRRRTIERERRGERKGWRDERDLYGPGTVFESFEKEKERVVGTWMVALGDMGRIEYPTTSSYMTLIKIKMSFIKIASEVKQSHLDIF